ncbi:hypothetical protein HanRHA438_Chr06g0278201 [Helianthus annuus]|nr:hypothetical protein HanRHA438_Chr06g0278201 [Helianthus annuus]
MGRSARTLEPGKLNEVNKYRIGKECNYTRTRKFAIVINGKDKVIDLAKPNKTCRNIVYINKRCG